MPRQTVKGRIIDKIYLKGSLDLIELNSSDESEAEDIELNVIQDVAIIESFRFGEIEKVPKQTDWLTEVLPNLDEIRFQEMLRVTYEQFDKIYNIIKNHQVFQPLPFKNQFDVSIQLAITLYRLGKKGAQIADIATLFGVGDGSTITRITRRVFNALLDVESTFIYWPSKEERDEIIIPALSDSLPGCFGFIDGTKIELDEAPHIDKEAYFDKDRNYSLQVQLVCDHQLRIRQFVVGYPGSCHDSRVWNECHVALNPDLYFSADEWLCADKGYGLSKLLINPFRENSPAISKVYLRWFNKYFSGHRVAIEHVNGILKETFQSLKCLNVKINDIDGHGYAIDWIKACLILYNIIRPTELEVNIKITEDAEEKDNSDDEMLDDFNANDKRMALFYFVKEKLGK